MRPFDPFGASRGGWSLGPVEDRKPEPTVRADDADRYVREALIGEGGMGSVYLALDRRLGRHVALKEAKTHGGPAQALEREAQLAASLDHPGVVGVHDIGRTEDGRPFYAMHLVRGQTLAERLDADPDEATRRQLLTHVRDACHAVGYAHAQGIFHRDLKPANVLVGAFGETRVVDWGLALRAGEACPEVAVGTPSWLPPEQARGEATDARSDVWALGAVLYHLLAGSPPYPASATTLSLARAGQVVPLDQAAPSVPAELRAIVTTAMHPDPAQRYADAHALAADLDRYLTGDRVRAHTYSPSELLGRLVRAWRAALTVGAVALLLGVGLLVGASLRLAAERDRAVDAETQAETALRTALVAQARAAAEAAHWGQAGELGAAALALGEHAEARGAVVGARSQRGLTRVETLPLGACPGAVLDGEGVLCADGFSLWRRVEGVERWRVAASVVDLAVAGSQVGLNLVRGAQVRSLSTGEVLEEGSRLSPLPLLGTPDGRYATRRWEGSLWSGSLVDAGARTLYEGCGPHGFPREATLHPQLALHAAACADGAVVITRDGAVTVWPEVLAVQPHGDVVFSTFSPEGDVLWLGTLNGSVARLNMVDGTVRVLPSDARVGVVDLAASPNGKLLAVRRDGGTLEVFDAATVEPVATLPVPDVVAMRWANDGTLRVAAGELTRWKVGDDTRLPVVHEDRGVSVVGVAPDGATWLTAHADGQLVLREPTGAARHRLTVGAGTVMSANFEAGGATVLVSTGEQFGARRYDVRTGLPVGDLVGNDLFRMVVPLGPTVLLGVTFAAESVRLDADGRTTPAGCPTKELRFASAGSTQALLVSVDGEVWVAGADGCSGALPGVRARRAALSADELWVAAADTAQLARHALNGAVIWRVPLATPPLEVAVSPDGRWVAVGGLDHTVRVFDADDGREHAVLRGHTQRVSSVAFDPDGDGLVSGSWDGTARWWSMQAMAETSPEAPLRAAGWTDER